MLKADMRSQFVPPADYDIMRPGRKSRRADFPGKFRTLNRRIYDQNLVFLNINADADYQLGIFF